MSDIEELERYIDLTKMKNKSRYQMLLSDIQVIYELFDRDAYSAICLAFNYGRAKGYRAAKAEVRA